MLKNENGEKENEKRLWGHSNAMSLLKSVKSSLYFVLKETKQGCSAADRSLTEMAKKLDFLAVCTFPLHCVKTQGVPGF